MQATRDIFGIWPDINSMADEIGEKPDTVYRWDRKRRIPEPSWQAVIEGAKKRSVDLTASDILAFNAPMKQRGRPAHKIRRRRKAELRAT